VNQWSTLRNLSTGSNLVDLGRGAVRDTAHQRAGGVNSEAGFGRRWGGHGEGLRRRRGDAAGVELGASLTDRWCVNVGTIHVRPPTAHPVRRWAGPSPADGCGWGGGPVVVAGVTTRRGRPGEPDRRAKLRRLTRRWITLTEGRGSEGGGLWVTRLTWTGNREGTTAWRERMERCEGVEGAAVQDPCDMAKTGLFEA
jgi:hypothetical protein